MAEQKHTPGPWNPIYKSVVAKNGRCVANCPSGGGCYVGPSRPLEAETNARLIASTLELLEACKAIVKAFELNNGWTEAVAKEIQGVRTAIARTEK